VLTLHPDQGDFWEQQIEKLEIPLLRIPRRNPFERLKNIVHALQPFDPELIHGWHVFATPYAGFAAKILGAKSLGSVRGSFDTFQSSPFKAYLALNTVDGLLVNSCSTGSLLQQRQGRKRLRIHTVQNAVEEPLADREALRQDLANRFGISPHSLWIGSLGRLDPKKHFDLILRALALVRETVSDFHFLLIGKGQERVRLEAMARELDLGAHVIFLGEMPNASTWLSALDIFCYTSLDEGLPNVVMEAAAAGLPIVAWRIPFMEEVLGPEGTGMLVELGDVDALKGALLSLMRCPDVRKDLGEAGRVHVLTQFAVTRYLKAMTGVYESMLGPLRQRR
jgi:glycosyltransferase involved in cell wall biosynthesis